MVEERIEVVTLACRGAVIDWRGAVEAMLYAEACRHGESPLDRGRALRRRLEAMTAPGEGPAVAYERLVAERGWRWARPATAALARAAAMCRPFPDVAPALAATAAAGVRVVAVYDARLPSVEPALRPLDGGFEAVLPASPMSAARALGVPSRRMLHVATGGAQLRAARALGMRAAWLNRRAAAAPADASYDVEWRTLAGLAEWAAGLQPVAAQG